MTISHQEGSINILFPAAVSIHIYLLAITIWYGALLFWYMGDYSIPQYVKDFFDREHGEAASFCFSILFFLDSIGTSIETIYLDHPLKNLPAPILLLYVFITVIFLMLSIFFFISWQTTAARRR